MELVVVLSFLASTVLVETSNSSGHLLQKRQSKYICGTEPFLFHSDVPCNAYTLCSNGGVKLFIGCTSNIQCQLHNADSVCIDQCCCTLPRMMEGSTNKIFYDSAHSISSTMLAVLIIIALLEF
ncbi:hypothetical protein Q1695_005689 [Nippostrongylus brasiliensis]|nr:hypothetical protein Q1695_005689 [Nippostrongylus brasiliensis]